MRTCAPCGPWDTPDVRPGITVVFETVHGSRAYGLATESSDTDLRGVFVPSPLAMNGYLDGPDQLEPSPERVLYEVRKFFRLAAVCNPTVIEVLFTDPEDHVVVAPEGRLLLDRRREFLSRLAGDSFGKYGLAQLQRIRTHRRWLLAPPKKKPERGDYGLQERSTIPRDEQGAVEAMLRDGRLTEPELPASFLDLLDRERRYRSTLREWQQYQQWILNRNPVRADLERRFGYDTKHAMHLIRLLRMAVEILSSGEVIVRRPDAEDLLAVRRGALSFDDLLHQAEALGSRVKTLAEGSPLPPHPDEDRLNVFCAELVADVHRRIA
jgi:predicted nucleotidyltransferase